MSRFRWDSISAVQKRWELLEDKHKYELLVSECEIIRNKKSRICIKCLVCSNSWLVTCNSFFYQGSRCSTCSKKLWTMEKVIKYFSEIEDIDNYNLVESKCETIFNQKSKLCVKCLTCGNVWKVSCNKFFNSGTRCFICSHNLWTMEKVIKYFREIEDIDKYSLVESKCETIVNHNSKLCVKCLTCENVWKVTCDNFFNKSRRCPSCRSSKGEEMISSYLNANSIAFQQEKTFDKLIWNIRQRIDFWLPDYSIAIEYHGRQHYKPYKFSDSGSKSMNFIEGQMKDANKRWFFKSKGIKFIEVPYTINDEIKLERFLRYKIPELFT